MQKLIEALKRTRETIGDVEKDEGWCMTGDDVLSRFLGSSLPIKPGESILIIGENLTEPLKRTSIDLSETLCKSKVTISYAYLSPPRSQLELLPKSSESTVDGDNLRNHLFSPSPLFVIVQDNLWVSETECDELNPEIVDLLARFESSFDHIWINPCPSKCEYQPMYSLFYRKEVHFF